MRSAAPSVNMLLLSATFFTPTILADTIELRIIETTDIHTYIMDYDYYRDTPSPQVGFTRTATLVKQAQQEVKNSVLVDNGDLIQGSPMGDYMAARGIKAGEVHPVYKAMNQMGYEVGNIGNHEFNFGLDFLMTSLEGANFPYISANVYDLESGEHLFTPYLIKSYQFVDSQGVSQIVRIGYIGFVPPQIMVWDKAHLEGKVRAQDIVESAKQLVPEMKARGADVIVAIPHSGISTDPYQSGEENATFMLSKVEGIDAIAFGHTHAVFPSADFEDIQGVDVEKGQINGVTSVMPGRWGSHVGIMDLTLKLVDGRWKVVDGIAQTRAIYDNSEQRSLAEADQAIVDAVKQDHIETREFVNQPIGKASDVMYSFLALVQDDPTIQIVNLAQTAYVERMIQGDPDLDGLPVLSAAAPFKVGGRKNDPNNFTEVEAGQLTFRNAADLYLYPNTLVALKVSGNEVKEWLECSAGQFNTIDASSPKPQSLINWESFRTYNFDVIDGVEYQIDVTQPARYDADCNLLNPDSSRIVNLNFKGEPIDLKQPFIIATNNYRAFSNAFPGTGEEFIAFEAPDENRNVLANYISRVSSEKGQVVPSADDNWSFAPIDSEVALDIRFETSPSEKASQFIKANSVYPIKQVDNDEIGFAIYSIDLRK